jgi:hypothetical protein
MPEDEPLTHADALDLDTAIAMIADELSLPVGAAQLKLIEACASGMVLAWERIPERGHDDIYWWDGLIPAAEWKDPDAHIDQGTGLVFLKGNAYGSRMISEPRGRCADGLLCVKSSMAKVVIDKDGLRYWLNQQKTPNKKPKRKALGKRPLVIDHLRKMYPDRVPNQHTVHAKACSTIFARLIQLSNRWTIALLKSH